LQGENAYQHTSVKFCDINALNDLSGISSIFPEPPSKEGSDIRVLGRVLKDWIYADQQPTNRAAKPTVHRKVTGPS
jgi:hypothetical protein